MKIALVGQPNCGKSTLFNAVAGYRSLTSNLAGTTVEYTRGQARVDGLVLDLVDLPGLYSLTPSNPVEAITCECLLSGEWDVIINVIDASQLPRSLELTLEIMDLEAPLVICLNMMDEAARKGIVIDSKVLSTSLGVPVVETIAARGQGILESFRAALALTRRKQRDPVRPFAYAPEIEDTLARLARELPRPVTSTAHDGESVDASREGLGPALPSSDTTLPTQAEGKTAFPPARFEALQLLQGNPRAIAPLDCAGVVREARDAIARYSGQPVDAVISSARHAACLNLFERVARVTRPRRDWREQVDRLVMHPVWGYVILVLVFLGIFHFIFSAGKFGEDFILDIFNALIARTSQYVNPHGVLFSLLKGALLGVEGAVAVVLPYLLPFLACLAVLEDLGYLSRVGYLMDALMHRVGLHGTATLPVLLGYGCSVPAVMATRILSTRRDRFIAAFLAVLVPCSARMTVILALVGVYLGANYALGIYILNLLVVVLSGYVLALIWPEISPGMLMEVPAFRLPSLKVVVMKTWWRLREFVLVAFPLLVAGSAILSLIEFCNWSLSINALLSPLTALLGLPRSTGLTLVFGVMRKELSLLMLMQALGTTNVASVMSAAQIIIFTLFVTFYIPCMATLASMFRELGWRLTVAASTALLGLALGVSLAARVILAAFH